MALKRRLRDGYHFQRRHLLSTIFKGVGKVQKMEELIPMLEPLIRKCVREEVNQAIQAYVSGSSDTETGSLGSRSRSESRNLRLLFESKLPTTVFTGNKILSENTSSIKIRLYDPSNQQTVNSGPFSSLKVGVVVVEGDFSAEEWSKTEFDSKVVENREGKSPLITGELLISLKNGEGYINHVCFTDNSSWSRSGKFRLGVRVHSACGETSVREGISNAFKVLDHRGESYQKLHPPNLNSEVWRLEKIAKGGAHHKQLSDLGISNVGDFLRSYVMNDVSLRTELKKISNKKWEKIIEHAKTCILDDKKYIYRDAGGDGTALVFDCIYSVIGVIFEGQMCHSLHTLSPYQKKRVEDLKQRAYGNPSNWEIFENGQEILQMNKHETQHCSSSFEMGESSQGFNLIFNNSFGVADYMEPQEFTVADDFENH